MAKRYPAKRKFQDILKLQKRDKMPRQVAKAYGIHPYTAGKWKQQFLEKGAEVLNQDGVAHPAHSAITKVVASHRKASDKRISISCGSHLH